MHDRGTVQGIVADLLTRFQQALESGQRPAVEAFAREGTLAILAALSGQGALEAAPMPGQAGEATSELHPEVLPKPRPRVGRDMRVGRWTAGSTRRTQSFGATSAQMQRIRPPSAWSNEASGLDHVGELTPG